MSCRHRSNQPLARPIKSFWKTQRIRACVLSAYERTHAPGQFGSRGTIALLLVVVATTGCGYRSAHTSNLIVDFGYEPHEESVVLLFSSDSEELAREMLDTERDTVIALRNEEDISDQTLRRIQHDIDLAEARLQQPG
jgi:hypothetical protein